MSKQASLFCLQVALAVLSPATGAAMAEQFKLLKGKAAPVCEAYKQYLESVDDPLGHTKYKPDEELLPCRRKIPSEFPEFSQPQWREFDPREHMDLAIAVQDHMSYVMDQDDPPAWMASLSSARHREGAASSITVNHEHNHDKWYLGEADVDNDGQPDPLLRYRRGRCTDYQPESLRYSVPIMVIDSQGKDIVLGKTRQLLRLDKTRTLGVLTQSFDVFAYKGDVYVDRWENEGSYKGKRTVEKSLTVYLHRGDRTTLVCRYRYVER